jgi:hypothetical protein
VRCQLLTTVLVLEILLTVACGRDPKEPENDGCRKAYAKLEALGCIETTKQVFARGCFADDIELRPADCDLSVMDPCVAVIAEFEQQPGGWSEALDNFLMHDCDPNGPLTFEMPKPDIAALRRAKAQADAAMADANAKTDAAAEQLTAERLAAEHAALEPLRARSIVKLGKPEIQGRTSKDQVLEVLNVALPNVRECHVAALVNNPDLVGEISIHFVIGSDGSVKSTVVQESTIDDPELGRCINRAVKKLAFATPEGGNTLVTAAFELELAK